MENRNFQLDTEWNMVHYPEKPNGFGILIIGDDRQFVDAKNSFWTQNEGKNTLLKKLKESGYTVFYSNLYGKNWGSKKAAKLAHRLYEHIMKNEILNEKVHILAEGMGALTALKLASEMGPAIRSFVFINPVLSLTHHLELEKEHKFFYKKLVKEIAAAHEVGSEEIEETIRLEGRIPDINGQIPMLMIHVLAGKRSFDQFSAMKKLLNEWKEKQIPVSICYILPEKNQQIGRQVIKFFKKHESIL
ncbi:hydrolase [Bacillus canaveralius]|uniref:Hydrolase n=1 Tax=Bacillus canaveralius TaxID=1403243 RepID=A0A2N5GKL1_9BACI|nr:MULTISPECIES: hydrolase [Bacillus]PLR82010.1 hydrolase [Bacillus canaveralius]PLR83324.1 hydrolase [Bacillus sp. V33-4]PLR99396.1 hydrolase [Bacillus canaveralius]